MKLTFIQPKSWNQQPYLPNGLLMSAAQISATGLAMPQIIDENLGSRMGYPNVLRILQAADAIGIGCLGPPLIPQALRVARQLRQLGLPQPIILGGEVIRNLTTDQFKRIFSDLGEIRQIANEGDLANFIGRPLPSKYEISMSSAIAELPEAAREKYFSKEFCIFTSQGCAYNCRFCAASKDMRENFREINVFREEMFCLAQMVKRYAGAKPNYEAYLSTLDGCQNPDQMEERLQVITEAMSTEGVKLPLRFLATANRVVKAANKDRDLLGRWHRNYNVSCIGIGVDGPMKKDNPVWKRENKNHNTESNVESALSRIAEAGIQPEGLMVMAFPDDSLEDIVGELLACLKFARNGIRARPFLGKSHTPGSENWKEDPVTAEQFLAQPDLFSELDYGGLGSPVTHPNQRSRRFGNVAYLLMTFGLKLTKLGCPTQPLFPTVSVSKNLAKFGQFWNRRMPQDR